MNDKLEEALTNVFGLLDAKERKLLYNVFNNDKGKTPEEEELEAAVESLKNDLLEEQKQLKSKDPNELTDKEKLKLSVNYVNIERSATKTYLRNHRFIVDLNQKIKIIETGPVVLQYIYKYSPTSVFYEQTRTIADELKRNYQKYKTLKLIHINKMDQDSIYPIDRFKKSIFMMKYKKNGRLVAPKKVEFDQEYQYEDDKGRLHDGIKIEITIPNHTKDKEIEIFTSFSLPTDIFENEDPIDTYSFFDSAALTTISIQEEIYGSSSPLLSTSSIEEDLNTSETITIDPIEEDVKSIYYCKNTWQYQYKQKGAKKYINTVTRD